MISPKIFLKACMLTGEDNLHVKRDHGVCGDVFVLRNTSKEEDSMARSQRNVGVIKYRV